MLVREGMPAPQSRVSAVSRGKIGDEDSAARRVCRNGVVTSPAATRPNQRWSMDFVSDCVSTGKAIWMLTLVDDCTRGSPAIEVNISPGASSDGACRTGSLVSVDCRERSFWTTGRSFAVEPRPSGAKNGVRLEFIQPCKPGRTPTWRASTAA